MDDDYGTDVYLEAMEKISQTDYKRMTLGEPYNPRGEKMKYLAFDIEIIKEIPEGEDWKKHRPLGISCAATLRSGDISPVRWYSQGGYTQGKPMKQVDLLKLVDYMEDQRALGFIPLTWNGLGFDFDVLAEESGDSETSADLAFNHIDMMFHFLCVKGYPLGLNTAAEGLGLSGKTEGMKGDLAPPMWTGDNERLAEMGRPDLARMDDLGKRALILDYVSQDVVTTLEVAETVDKRKHLPWTSMKGRANSAAFPDGWLTVKQAKELPEPDTNWMTNPLKREDLLEWLSHV